MKLGQAEGTPEEIKNFIENNGLDPTKFFETQQNPTSKKWFIGPLFLLLTSILGLIFIPPEYKKAITIFFVIGTVGLVWICTLIQILFKNVWATCFLGIGTIFILLIAMGIVSPSDLPEEARKWKPEK